jgi:hypothetical protein
MTVEHARGAIDEQRAPQIRILFILLNYQAVLPRPHLPVDMADVIASYILTMLHELDRLPKIRTSVST